MGISAFRMHSFQFLAVTILLQTVFVVVVRTIDLAIWLRFLLSCVALASSRQSFRCSSRLDENSATGIWICGSKRGKSFFRRRDGLRESRDTSPYLLEWSDVHILKFYTWPICSEMQISAMCMHFLPAWERREANKMTGSTKL